MRPQIRGAHAHQPWPAGFWLLLAVLSNANGSILVTALFLPSPLSYIASAVYIVCYRRYSHITTDDMPIAIDLYISLLCQTLVTEKSWEFALYAAFLQNLALYYVCYFIPLVLEYFRLRNRPTFNDAIRPLSKMLWFGEAIALHFLQGIFFIWIRYFAFEDPFYGVYQVYAGFFLVAQSIAFLMCYRVNRIRNRVAFEVLQLH